MPCFSTFRANKLCDNNSHDVTYFAVLNSAPYNLINHIMMAPTVCIRVFHKMYTVLRGTHMYVQAHVHYHSVSTANCGGPIYIRSKIVGY